MREIRNDARRQTGTRRHPFGDRATASPTPRPPARFPRRAALLLLLNLLTGSWGFASVQQPAAPPARLRVTCTTTMLSAVVHAVGADSVDTHTIVPFGMCPGHFDLTPGEADRLREADILLYHGFEPFIKGVTPGPKTKWIAAGVMGNWMLPAVHTQAVESIRAILTEAMPAAGPLFAERAGAYSRAVALQAQGAITRRAALRDTPVVCAAMNRDWAAWLGFRVVAEFARDEDVSVKALHGILTEGRASGAALVIDNTQSSGKIGRTLADALGIPLVMQSHFPVRDATDADAYPYLETFNANVDAVVKPLESQGTGIEGQQK